MDWEWVAPIATASTGVAGVAFTYLTSRSSNRSRVDEIDRRHEHQHQGAVRQERREAYGAYLAALDSFDRAVSDAGEAMLAHKEAVMTQERMLASLPPEAHEMTRAFDDLDMRFQDVLLVCGQEATVAATGVRDDALECWRLATTQPADWRYIKRPIRRRLIDAMREDLGYGPSGWETSHATDGRADDAGGAAGAAAPATGDRLR